MNNQLPAALARWLAAKSTDAVHVLDLALETATDLDIWTFAAKAVSSLWVRMGNCRTTVLLARFDAAWPGIEQSFAAGHRVVTLF